MSARLGRAQRPQPRYSAAMGPDRGSAVLERRPTEAPIRVDTRAPGEVRRNTTAGRDPPRAHGARPRHGPARRRRQAARPVRRAGLGGARGGGAARRPPRRREPAGRPHRADPPVDAGRPPGRAARLRGAVGRAPRRRLAAGATRPPAAARPPDAARRPRRAPRPPARRGRVRGDERGRGPGRHGVGLHERRGGRCRRRPVQHPPARGRQRRRPRGSSPRQHPARQRRRRDRPRRPLRLLPRDREHHLPARVDDGPPPAGGLDLRRRVPAQRSLHVGPRPRARSSLRAPTTRGSWRPPRRSRRSRGWTSSTTCSSTSRASAASSTRWAASTSRCSAARRSAPRPTSRAGSRPAGSTSTATTPSGTPAAGPTRRTTSGWRASAASSRRWSASSTPRPSSSTSATSRQATKGVFRTDIPQEALASLGTLAAKTKQQKITSVNFVPPLIMPWSYDPPVVHRAVDRRSARPSRPTRRRPTAPRPPRQPAAPSATAAKSGAEPKKQAVMERPASDPDANTADLAGVCSAG